MSDYAIEINNVSKIYKIYKENTHRLKEALHPFKKKYHKDFYALKDISFKIKKGTTVGFIGENGSGKSTLLKILTGIIPSTKGDVKVNGKISALLELGTGFNPELTGLENIYFNGTILGYTRKEIDGKKGAIIKFAEIGEFIHQPVKTYSSGMFVRLAFSVAINVDPDIIIIDEALSVGDSYFQVKCINKLKEFKNSGKTILFVSHDPGAVKTLCEEAFLLEHGNIIDSGRPDKVFDYYNSLISIKKEERHLIDKDVLRERSGNKKIEILKVVMLNEKNEPCDSFVSGVNVVISIEVKVHEEILNPTFGIAIRDRLGNDIFGINNYLLKVDFGTLQKDNLYSIKYSMKLDIGVNVYSLTVACHSGLNHITENYDWISCVQTFKVIPNSDFNNTGYCKLYPTMTIENKDSI